MTSIWRCFPISLHSSTISAYLPKPKYKLSYIISTNITTRSVRHHSLITICPLDTWGGRHAPLCSYLTWIVVPSSLYRFRLVILLIDSDRHCSVQTFRLVILLIDSDRHYSVQTFRLVILLIDSDRHCSVQTFRLSTLTDTVLYRHFAWSFCLSTLTDTVLDSDWHCSRLWPTLFSTLDWHCSVQTLACTRNL